MSRPLVYGPLVERAWEEQAFAEAQRPARPPSASLNYFHRDLPPLAHSWRPAPHSDGSPYLRRLQLMLPYDRDRSPGQGLALGLRHLTSSSIISQSSDMRYNPATLLRENAVLKARVKDLETLVHMQADELQRYRSNGSKAYDDGMAQRVSSLEDLQSIAKLMSDTDLDTMSMINGLVELTATALNCERVSLFLLSEDGKELYLKTANDCVPDIRVPVGAGIVGTVARTTNAMNIADAQNDPRFFKGSDKKTGFTTVSILCQVIQTPAGSVVGVIQAINKRPRTGGRSTASARRPRVASTTTGIQAVAFTQEDEHLLQNIVSQASIALHNMMLYDQATAARARAQALLDLVNSIAVERDFRTLTNNVIRITADALSAKHVFLVVFNSERQELWTLPYGERAGWSISYNALGNDSEPLADSLERHRVFESSAPGRAQLHRHRQSISPDDAEAEDSHIASLPVDLSWLVWQVARTGEKLNSTDMVVGLEPLNCSSRHQQVGIAASRQAASEDGSIARALLVFPCVDHKERVIAVLVAAEKAAVVKGFDELDASAGPRNRYFDANDEELMAAICSKVALAFELRSKEVMTSKMAMDMAQDDSAGRLGAFDIGDITEHVYASAGSRWMRIRDQLSRHTMSFVEADLGVETSQLQTWSLNLFNLTDSELHAAVLAAVKSLGLLQHLALDTHKLLRLCNALHINYRDNPYHNYRHAVSVMQVCFLVLTTTDAAERYSPTSLLGVILACLFHDVDHPGTNNAFHVNSGSELAVTYNDQSVLENHHCAKAFQILRDDPLVDVTSNLDPKDRKEVRSVIIKCILSTDMSKHFQLVQALKGLSTKHEEHSDADRMIVLESVVHAADLSNPLMESSISRRWADAVLQEFNHQAALEQEMGLPYDPKLLKNDLLSQANLNRGFIDYIVSPLWTTLAQHFPPLESGLVNLAENRAGWDKIINDHTTQPEKPGLVRKMTVMSGAEQANDKIREN